MNRITAVRITINTEALLALLEPSPPRMGWN